MANKSKKTFTFEWKGKDRSGQSASGDIEAMNIAIAKAELRKQGVNVKKIGRKKAASSLFGGGKIKPGDIAIFTRQLATMLKSGVPLLQAFDITLDGIENAKLKTLLQSIKQEVAGGTPLSDALRKHPEYFDDLYCSLVGSGEQSGELDTLLDRIATYKEKSEALRNRIKKAMNYPIAVVLIAFVVTGILLIKVVPQFQEVFAGFGAELPAFTMMVINLSEFVQSYWLHAVGGFVAIGYLFKRSLKSSKTMQKRMDRLLLKLPIIGEVLDKSAVARFGRTLSTTFAAGVPLVEALDSVIGASGNIVYAEATARIKIDVSTGMQLQTAMKNTGVFPSMALQLVSIGEESGALDEMLDKVATHYEEEVDAMVDGMTSLMEPIIMSVLGVLVGGLIVAMYLPIFQLGAVV